MKLTPEQLRQTAAAMLAFADGKPIEYRAHGDLWVSAETPSWQCDQVEYRPKPWSLPDPPAGRKWHRYDWKEEMLPVIDGKQTRPLLADEEITEEDWRLPLHLSWAKNSGDWKSVPSKHPNYFFRTTRPLPAEPKVRPWRQEEVPCGIYLRHTGKQDAHYLPVNIFRDGIEITFKARSYFLTWEMLAKFYEHSTDRKTWLPCTVTET